MTIDHPRRNNYTLFRRSGRASPLLSGPRVEEERPGGLSTVYETPHARLWPGQQRSSRNLPEKEDVHSHQVSFTSWGKAVKFQLRSSHRLVNAFSHLSTISRTVPNITSCLWPVSCGHLRDAVPTTTTKEPGLKPRERASVLSPEQAGSRASGTVSREGTGRAGGNPGSMLACTGPQGSSLE